MNTRYYVRVSDFALARVIEALTKDKTVRCIAVSMEDDYLLVSFEQAPVNNYRPVTGGEVQLSSEETDTQERFALKVACGMSDCEHNAECVKQCKTYCGGRFYVKKVPLESEAKNG